jgi:hypothetical protein
MELLTMKLEKQAKGKGGDKYECGDFNIYLPQTISRKNGSPVQVLYVYISDKECENGLKMTFDKKAKKSGGDKYTINENFNVYVPQRISRKNGQSPSENLYIVISDIDEENINKVQ